MCVAFEDEYSLLGNRHVLCTPFQCNMTSFCLHGSLLRLARDRKPRTIRANSCSKNGNANEPGQDETEQERSRTRDRNRPPTQLLSLLNYRSNTFNTPQ